VKPVFPISLKKKKMIVNYKKNQHISYNMMTKTTQCLWDAHAMDGMTCVDCHAPAATGDCQIGMTAVAGSSRTPFDCREMGADANARRSGKAGLLLLQELF
jgi:hypothetical protein